MARTQQRVSVKVSEVLAARYYKSFSTAGPGIAAKMQEDLEEATEELMRILWPDRDLSVQQEMVGALCSVMGLDSSLNGERVAKLATALLRADERYTPDLVLREYGEGGGYYENYWKGQRGERPGEQEIRATILQAVEGWPNTSGTRGARGV